MASLVQGAISRSRAEAAPGPETDWITTIANALSIESVLHVSAETLVCITSVTKDSAFAALSVVSTVSAFRRCIENGFFSVDALVVASSGLSALVSLDNAAQVAIGVSVGIAKYSGITGSFVTFAAFATKVQQGDVPGALLSGTKLIATIALAGHPVALGVVIAADVSYKLYCAYHAYYAPPAGVALPDHATNSDLHDDAADALLFAVQTKVSEIELGFSVVHEVDLHPYIGI